MDMLKELDNVITAKELLRKSVEDFEEKESGLVICEFFDDIQLCGNLNVFKDLCKEAGAKLSKREQNKGTYDRYSFTYRHYEIFTLIAKEKES